MPPATTLPSDAPLERLYPLPHARVNLKGLYLAEGLDRLASPQRPLLYSNFVCSLDGRVAVRSGQGPWQVPPDIANPRDWRLYQELGASADAWITTGRYLRSLPRDVAQHGIGLDSREAYSDLIAWRAARGLPRQPAAVILSASLDFHLPDALANATDRVMIVTVATAARDRIARLEQRGAIVLRVGEGDSVDPRQMVETLVAQGLYRLYCTAGPRTLHGLLAAGVVSRLYLTLSHRLLGGSEFETLIEGPRFPLPIDMQLESLYHDPHGAHGANQSFAAFRLPGAVPADSSPQPRHP